MNNNMGQKLALELKSRTEDVSLRLKQVQAEGAQATSDKRKEELAIKQVKKKTNELFQQQATAEKDSRALQSQIKELTTMTSGVVKMTNELNSEKVKLDHQLTNFNEEQQIYVGQLVRKGLEDQATQEKLTSVIDAIKNEEETVRELKSKEVMLLVQINFLTTIKEKMARTASNATAQARDTGEELKVKELLILDLTKKQQDTQFKLNMFISMYEDVKTTRNKYVSNIQATSQDLAEMRERIKILQNEFDILKTDSQEKERALADILQVKHQQMSIRDNYWTELNRKEFEFTQKLATIGQLINHGDKLNLIINSLQNEMNNLIYEYEHACESRNYMGIQLIDRNDELCILYEKSNIQENILKNGEQKIREREERIRMILLELKERSRQLKVVRDQIPIVPQLADKVIALNSELEVKKHEVQKLSEMIERGGGYLLEGGGAKEENGFLGWG